MLPSRLSTCPSFKKRGFHWIWKTMLPQARRHRYATAYSTTRLCLTYSSPTPQRSIFVAHLYTNVLLTVITVHCAQVLRTLLHFCPYRHAIWSCIHCYLL